MAEYRKKHQDGIILSDDLLKDAYKAGLNQLKASDELIKTTLSKCRMELDTDKGRLPLNRVLSRATLRYGAPIAACLLVLVILLNHPMLFGSKSESDSAYPQASEMMTADHAADSARAPESPAMEPQVKSSEGNMLIRGFPEQNDLVHEAPNGKGDSGSYGMMTTENHTALNSIDYNHFLTSLNGDMPTETIKAILDVYNSERGTQYTCDDNRVLTVTTLKTGGIRADSLREASGFNELIGDQEYHLLPLQDENHEWTVLLPVVESAIPFDDPSTAPLDIVFSQSGRTWLSSQYSGIPATDSQVDYLLNRTEHQQLVRDTFNVTQISDYRVVDINYGYDYIIIVEADGREYAIPLLETGSRSSLENRRVYLVRDVLKGLADSLEAR